jgi:hypothetical protein
MRRERLQEADKRSKVEAIERQRGLTPREWSWVFPLWPLPFTPHQRSTWGLAGEQR